MSRFTIGERRFRELVAGKVISTRDDSAQDVDIVLAADLDYPTMLRAIGDAMAAAVRPPEDPPEARELRSRRGGFLKRPS